jgi:hypothetical protein
MPLNPATGRTSRRQMAAEDIHAFRIKQAEALRKGTREAVKKGKRRAPESPDAEDQEGSALAASPHAPLVDLEKLSLDGGKPSPAGSPADSPATLSQPPLENPAPKARKRSKPSPSKSPSKSPSAAPTQHLAGPAVEAPSASQFLLPAHSQASHSPGSASPSDGTNLSQAARIDMLEAKQREMEQRQHELEAKHRAMENMLRILAERLRQSGQ